MVIVLVKELFVFTYHLITNSTPVVFK